MELGDGGANTGQQQTTSMPMPMENALVESSEPDEAGRRGLGPSPCGSRPLKTLTELLSCPCEVCSTMTNKMPDRQDYA